MVDGTDDTELARFRVRRVLFGDGSESWTVVGGDFEPVEVLDRYLAWLTALRSPRTVEGYARDLCVFWCFLALRELQWPQVDVETLGEWAAWLRQPAANVVALGPDAAARRSPETVNRMLSAVFGFYEHQARHGNDLAKRLIDRTRELLADAEHHSRERQIELLKGDELSLVRIIEGLDAITDDLESGVALEAGLDVSSTDPENAA